MTKSKDPIERTFNVRVEYGDTHILDTETKTYCGLYTPGPRSKRKSEYAPGYNCAVCLTCLKLAPKTPVFKAVACVRFVPR